MADLGAPNIDRLYGIVVEPDEDGGYVASAPSVPGIYEQGEAREEALGRMREAMTFHLGCMAEEGEELPPSDGAGGPGAVFRYPPGPTL